MGVFHQEGSPNASKRCKFLVAAGLRDAFSTCHRFGGKDSVSSLDDGYTSSDFEDDEEVVTLSH